MRYNIFKYNQQKAIEHKLDLKDLLILEWIQDFWPKMIKETINNKEYGWIKYEAMLADIPIIEINTKDGLYRRLKQITNLGFLEHTTVTNKYGTMSYYRVSRKILELLEHHNSYNDKRSNKTQQVSDENPTHNDFLSEGSDEKSEGYGSNSVEGSDEKSEQIDSPTNNSNTSNSNIPPIVPQDKNSHKILDIDERQKISNSKQKTKIKQIIPDFIAEETWNSWIEYRKEIKKPLKAKSIEYQIKQLTEFYQKGYNPNEIIEKSICNGWRGLFEPNTETQQSPNKEQCSQKNYDFDHNDSMRRFKESMKGR